MMNFEDALSCVLSHTLKKRVLKINPLLSNGMVLKEDLKAERPFPPFDRVAMDGIAVSSIADKNFESEGMQYAGDSRKKLNKNKCLEVMTGAVLPQGAQAVIRYEDLDKKNGVFVLKPNICIKAYQNVHRKGEDAKKGDVLVSSNTRLTPSIISLIASLGKKDISVEQPFKINVLATGDELVSNESKPKKHQIYSSNAEAIFAATGAKANLFYATDNLTSIHLGMEKGLEKADILIISGGVSFGEKDLVPLALQKFGVTKIIHGVLQKPGKPFWFGKKQHQLVFGLPGNPIAMLVCLYLYVLPLLGHRQEIITVLGEDIALHSKLAHFRLVKIVECNAYPVQSSGSGDLVALAKSDGFILPKTGEKGEIVRSWLWRV